MRWDDKSAHDDLFALARQRESYAWLAGRYRARAEQGDAIARERLATIQKVVTLTVMMRPPTVAEPPGLYRGLVRILVMCLVVLGLSFVLVGQARRSREARADRQTERGSAMLVTMLIVLALMSGIAVLSALTMASGHSAQSSRMANLALHCADAGLSTARGAAAANYASWNAALAAGTEPAWFSSLDKDIDGDGTADFTLTLVDNDDEGDPTVDSDLTVFVVSTCTKYEEAPVKVTELIRYNGGGHCYQSQLGGCGGNNNAN